MFNLFNILETFNCGCGKTIIPIFPFSKWRTIQKGESFCDFTYKAVECPRCNALWMLEDGYWSIVTKHIYKEITNLKIDKEKIKKEFIPDITFNDIIGK